MKFNQKDFHLILNEKMDQITKDLKNEREMRISEQRYSRV